MTIKIDFDNLNRMFVAIDHVGHQGVTINDYFGSHVCDQSGVDYASCALSPLGELFGQAAGWFGGAIDEFALRWRALEEGIASSAQQIDLADNHVDHDLTSYLPIPARPGYNSVPLRDRDIERFDLTELAGTLVEPEDGTEQLPKKHDKDFQHISEGYDDVRDSINTMLDWINKLPGLDLKPLPQTSLRTYIVYPLSGDYHRLQANAHACTIFNSGMKVWGSNFAKISLRAGTAIEGSTGSAVAAQLGLYDLAIQGVGGVVNAAADVFDGIAIVSEEIAIEVEKAIVMLGKKLLSLLKKVLKHISSLVGVAITIWDTLTTGFGWVVDIINDIEDVTHIINACFDLVDKVRAWAETQARRLDALQEIPGIIHDLPGVSQLNSLSAIESVDYGRIRRTLNDLVGEVDYGSADGRSQTQLQHALGSLVHDATPESHRGPEPTPAEPGPAPTAPTPPAPPESTPAPSTPAPSQPAGSGDSGSSGSEAGSTTAPQPSSTPSGPTRTPSPSAPRTPTPTPTP